MTIKSVAEILNAEILCGKENMDFEIEAACGSDLMSDVMAFVKDPALLITGLINVQVIRTANLMDIGAVCFIRGKMPNQEMIQMAEEFGIVLLATDLLMFPACGKLYEAGIRGGSHADMQTDGEK